MHTAAAALAVAWLLLLSFASPSAAAPGAYVNVEPESLGVGVGQIVNLTAQIQDGAGNPMVGPGTDTHVRWFFTEGSPNDIDSPGNSPDLECWTGTAGECSVSYLASLPGSDTICALTGGPTATCDEAVDAPEWNNSADVVQRLVGTDPGPTPTPTPTPDPTPTPTPDPTPTPTPTPDPTPTPTAGASEGVPPEETPAPTVEPTPDPTPPDEGETPPAQPDVSGPPGAEPRTFVEQVLAAAVQQVGLVVRPEAAAAVATEFGFPLALTIAVLGYLVLQGHIDRRDPKLRMAPMSALESIVRFEREEHL